MILFWNPYYGSETTGDGKGRWEYTYTLFNDSTVTQRLGKGDTEREAFNFIVTDISGAEREFSVGVIIRGGNDRPEIRTFDETTPNTVIEAHGTRNDVAAISTSGTITVYDIDDKHEGNAGDDPVRDSNNDLSDHFDFLVRGASTRGAAGPDGNPVVTDRAIGDTDENFEENAIDGLFGRLVIDPVRATWTYTLFTAADVQAVAGGQQGFDDINALDEGETISERFALRVRDSDGGVSTTRYVTITITGRNDAPTVVAYDADNNPEGGNPDPVTTSVDERITNADGSQSALPVAGVRLPGHRRCRRQ